MALPDPPCPAPAPAAAPSPAPFPARFPAPFPSPKFGGRPGLATQLFLAVLATAALVALAVGAAAQWNFQRGFLGYLNAQALQRLEVVMPRLEQAWREQGSWDFLRDRPQVWYDLVGVRPPMPGSAAARALGAGAASAGAPVAAAASATASATGAAASALPHAPHGTLPESPPAGPMPELLASDLLGAGRRLSLRDAQRQRVMGFPFILAGTEEREIVVDGRVVGYLAMAPLQAVTDEASLRFLDGQLRAALGMGLLAVGLAALIAWWVARSLLAPVRRVAAATHQLAAGHWDTRVAETGHDEVAQLAQDFNQLALTLQRNEQARRAYMADISHELRTPLAVLRGELEAIEDGIRSASPENLQRLQAQVATLTQLVNDLHALALAEVGALSYRREDLDLAALLRDELATLAHGCAERGLTLQHQLPEAPLRVAADPSRLRQLLHNLFANSLRYTDAGGRLRLVLSAADAADDGEDAAGTAVLTLDDSAPGVPAALLPRLFERFFRVEASRARASGGSGLGLAICRAIAEAHGGTLQASASPLGGLRITLRLPLLRALP